ncbi:MAG: DUF192 domain-containing protein [Bdellovibrionales bacterium]
MGNAQTPKPVFVKAFLGQKELQVEMADTAEARSQGLMYRRTMPFNQGMLFVFGMEQSLTFWMKNTYMPLSIGFFNSQLELVDIQDMQPESMLVKELPRYTSRKPARLALEMNQGWFAKNKIAVGAKLRFPSKDLPPSLRSFVIPGLKSVQPR